MLSPQASASWHLVFHAYEQLWHEEAAPRLKRVLRLKHLIDPTSKVLVSIYDYGK